MCPSDRREVQKHHCERWEPSFEKENQRANSGKTRTNCIFCMSSVPSVPLLPDTTVQMCLTGEPAVKTGADEVSDHSGLSAQRDGHAEDRANWSEHHLRAVNFLYFLTLFVYQIAVCWFALSFAALLFFVLFCETATLKCRRISPCIVCYYSAFSISNTFSQHSGWRLLHKMAHQFPFKHIFSVK